RDLGVVAVVDADELDALRGGGALQPGRDFLRALVIRTLRRVAEAKRPLLERAQVRSIEVFARLFDQAAAFQGVEQAEGHALGQPAACGDVAQRQRLARGAEGGQQVRRMDHRPPEVRVAFPRLRLLWIHGSPWVTRALWTRISHRAILLPVGLLRPG